VSHLPDIAASAKRLSVPTLVRASAQYWNDVVKNEVINRVTPAAFRIRPFLTLDGCEHMPVTLFFSRLRVAAHSFEHLVSIGCPARTERRSDLGSRFRCMLVTLQSAFPLRIWSGSFAGLYLCERFRAVRLSPKWIVRAAHGCALAFTLSASLVNAAHDVRAAAIEGFPANHAMEDLTGFVASTGTAGIEASVGYSVFATNNLDFFV
jgi:hypothetical protein